MAPKRNTRRKTARKTKPKRKTRTSRKTARKTSRKQNGGAVVPFSRFSEPKTTGGDMLTEAILDLPPILSFYSKKDCPYCVQFQPTWDELVTDQRLLDSGIALNMIQTYHPLSISNNPTIYGYPSLVASHPSTVGDVMFNQKFPRTTNNIITWLMDLNLIKEIDDATTVMADAITSGF